MEKRNKNDKSVRYITLDRKHQEKIFSDDVSEGSLVIEIFFWRNASGLVARRTTFFKVALSEHNKRPNQKVSGSGFEVID